jgi:GNAT superfamily N-acetyltransferase
MDDAPIPAMPPGRLRPAGPGDVEALVALQRAYYAEDGYPFAEREARPVWLGLLQEPARGRAWLVERGGATVGYVALTFGYSLEYRGVDAFVDELYLVPAARGQGLGGAALAVVEAACRERGVKALHLEVERDKSGAQALYRQRGFADRARYLLTKSLAPGADAPATPGASRPA